MTIIIKKKFKNSIKPIVLWTFNFFPSFLSLSLLLLLLLPLPLPLPPAPAPCPCPLPLPLPLLLLLLLLCLFLSWMRRMLDTSDIVIIGVLAIAAAAYFLRKPSSSSSAPSGGSSANKGSSASSSSPKPNAYALIAIFSHFFPIFYHNQCPLEKGHEVSWLKLEKIRGLWFHPCFYPLFVPVFAGNWIF